MKRTFVQLLNVATGERGKAYDVSHLTKEQQLGFREAIRAQAKSIQIAEIYEDYNSRDTRPAKPM